MQHSFEALNALARAHNQGHLFAFYGGLSPDSQQKLLAQVAGIEFDLIDKLVAEFVKSGTQESGGTLEPAPVIASPGTPLELQGEREARNGGEAAIRQGRAACFLVAGGQGTRLGLHGPKGAFKIGPITERTLFQLHAEKVLALRRRFNAPVPWLIMTSDANDAETRKFFETHRYFNLSESTVRIFKQGNMPAVARDGKILLRAKDEIVLSPNGHGGSIKALHDSGSIAWLKSLGMDTLFYFQVDNVLTKIGDPVFIGHHVKAKSEMSSKVCRKRNWNEKVGVLGLRNGKLTVVEYSDLPESVAKETDADSKDLKWWAGSIAIHVLDVNFIERLNKGGFQLPYHKAEKAVECIDGDGHPVVLKPGEKNGIKFETFIFDALGDAKTSVSVETRREDDFSPVKNAEGEDSPQTAQRDLMELYARWLTAAGTQVPRKDDGTLDCRIEISPLTSFDGMGLAKVAPKAIAPGREILL